MTDERRKALQAQLKSLVGYAYVERDSGSVTLDGEIKVGDLKLVAELLKTIAEEQ